MLPDIANDAAVAAAKKMGCQFLESFFYRAALEAGFRDEPHQRDAQDEAKSLYNIYCRQGYNRLPGWCQNYARLPGWCQNYARLRAGLKAHAFSQTPIGA